MSEPIVNTTQSVPSNAAPNAAPSDKPEAPKEPNFGDGRYSPATKELFKDLLRFDPDMTRELAEVIARDWASDFGRAFKNAPVSVKHGSTKSDGRMTLKEACAVKGIVQTNSLAIGRLIEQLNTARKMAEHVCQDIQITITYVKGSPDEAID